MEFEMKKIDFRFRLAREIANFKPPPVIVPPIELTPEAKRRLIIKAALERLLEATKEQEEETEKDTFGEETVI
jgi:hypothetical protein